MKSSFDFNGLICSFGEASEKMRKYIYIYIYILRLSRFFYFQMSPVDEEDDELGKQRSSLHIRNNSSDEDVTPNLDGLETEEIKENNIEELKQTKTDSMGQETAAALEPPKLNRFLNLSKKLTNLEIPSREDLFERLESDNHAADLNCSSFQLESPVGDQEIAEQAFSSDQEDLNPKHLFDQAPEENEVEAIPEESILKRINSRKGMNSYQLGKQLSCKWTTGAGPRIGCVRDYPSELQFRALEKVNLSPRSAARSRSYFSPQIISGLSPKVSTPTISSETLANSSSRISHHSRTHSSPLLRKASITKIN